MTLDDIPLTSESTGGATDYETRPAPELQQALVLTWQAGLMSKRSVLYNFQQGELLPPGRSVEAEVALIDAEAGDGRASPLDAAACRLRPHVRFW